MMRTIVSGAVIITDVSKTLKKWLSYSSNDDSRQGCRRVSHHDRQ